MKKKLPENTGVTPLNPTTTEREVLRLRAVAAVEDEGRTQSEVARLMGVTRASVSHWVRRHRADGEAALKSRPAGRPRMVKDDDSVLAPQFIARLLAPSQLWDGDRLSAEFKQGFGAAVSRWTIGRYLSEWDLMPTDTARLLREDIGDERRWQDTAQHLRKVADKAGAQVVWLGVRETVWRFGDDGVVVRSGGEGKGDGRPVHVLSATSGRGERFFMVSTDPASLWPEFLAQLLRERRRPVLAVVPASVFPDAKEVFLGPGVPDEVCIAVVDDRAKVRFLGDVVESGFDSPSP